MKNNMSKRGYISRYLLVLKRLKEKPYSTYEDLKYYLDNHFDNLQLQEDGLQLGFSKRTLQRDIKEIRDIFGIDIEYSKSQKGYFISYNENINFQRMVEALDIFNSLKLAQDVSPFVYIEKRRPQGTDNLYGLLHAIKNRLVVGFVYQKFWEDEMSHRKVEPYALKEFRNRWYLMAKDSKDGKIKSFALDRLSALEITNQHYEYPQNYDVEQTYRYSFGIIGPNNNESHNIVLSFTPFQGKYIKTLPLHHTQQVLVDDEDEVRIQLKLCISHDLLMELLSFGNDMKVLEPAELVDQVRSAHEEAFKQYSK